MILSPRDINVLGLTLLQVWGCGGEATKQAQLKQKTWEAQDIERQKMRKVDPCFSTCKLSEKH